MGHHGELRSRNRANPYVMDASHINLRGFALLQNRWLRSCKWLTTGGSTPLSSPISIVRQSFYIRTSTTRRPPRSWARRTGV